LTHGRSLPQPGLAALPALVHPRASPVLLSEAIVRRANLRARIARSKQLAALAADPEPHLADLLLASMEWAALVAAIQQTNARARLPDGRTLAAALADRTALRDQIEALSALPHPTPGITALGQHLQGQFAALEQSIAAMNGVVLLSSAGPADA
jgi:hypothetical protein